MKHHSQALFEPPTARKIRLAAMVCALLFTVSTLAQWTLRTSGWFNPALAVFSWLVLGFVTAKYLLMIEAVRRARMLTWEQILQQQASDTLEFKSSLRWDLKGQVINIGLEQAVVKTVVAFLNTAGGILVIGVAGDRTIHGLQPDYDSLGKNWEGFRLHLQQLLTRALGSECDPSHITIELQKVQGKDVCLVRVKRARGPVFLKEQNQPILYVRAGGASNTLNVDQALRYAQEHWGGYV